MKYNFPVYESVFQATSRQSVLVFEVVSKAFKPFWHFHPEIELTLITKGSGIRMVGDSIEGYQTGDLLLVGANLPHQWVSGKSDEGGQSALVIQFQTGLFEGIGGLEDLYRFLQKANMGYHFPQPDKEVTDRIKSLIHAPAPLQVSGLIEVLYLLASVPTLRYLSKTTKFNRLNSSTDQKLINETIDFIVDNLSQKLTVNQMAERCHMIPQAFCRWFRKQTGMSFVTYLNKTRIELACQYLLTTDLQVKSIAYSTGFDNISHFNRTFKKITGKSPLRYKVHEFQR